MTKALADILLGENMEGGEVFCDDIYNNLKNHWRVGEPGTPQPGMIWSDAANEKLFHRQAAAWMEIIQADNFFLSTLAAGGDALTIDAYQDDTIALTGLLRGAYIQASNGDEVATGIIRALELKARAGRPGAAGANVDHLEGLSISADAKTYVVGLARGAEFILDGGVGASITHAVGLRIAQNFQADIATTCYGLEFYWDSFEWEADIALASGGLIGGKNGHLKIASAGNIELASAAIGDDVRGLSSIYTLTADPAKSDGIALYAEGHIGPITTDGPTYGGGIWLNIDNGAILGADVRALDIGIYESGATCGGRNAYGLAIHMDFDDASPPAGIYPFRINCNDTAGHATPTALIFAPNEKAIGLITGDAGTADDAYLKIVMQNGDVYRIPLVKE